LKYRWLSYPLDIEGPRPPAIPKPELRPLFTIEEDGANVQILQVASHTGTHLDTPLHVIEGGVGLEDFNIEDFGFHRPAILDLDLEDEGLVMPEHLEPFEEKLKDIDIVLFRFGYGVHRRNDPQRYSMRSPGFGMEAAGWLREHLGEIRAIGMDVPSLACIALLDTTMKAHNVLLGAPNRRLLVIEDMNLEGDLSGLREVRVNPWFVIGMDSSPCSVIGIFET
jgi:kynurenine formamidase